MKERDYKLEANKIANMIYDVDTDDRGILFLEISKCLQDLTQGYTANLFKQLGVLYGYRHPTKEGT